MSTSKKEISMPLSGKNKYLFLLLCFITAIVPILYPTIMGKGFYFISNDFDEQMLPFLFNFRDAFEHGFNTYYWRFDLGTPMFYAYGYYGLGSIFSYLIFLVPRAFIPYIVSVAVLLKYIVACYTSLFFIRRFTRTEQAAMAGALLYAFSGFQCTNIVFFIFHDVTAIFPLMLISLDDIIRADSKRNLTKAGIFFSFSVAINCLANYVFFIQSVVAAVIYFVFMNREKISDFLKRTLVTATFGSLGVGLSGIVFIPSIIYIMGNERADRGIDSNLYLYDFKTIIYILKGIFLPGDIMLDETALLNRVWTSTSCYLPFVGMVFVIAYLIKNRDRLSSLVICLFAMSFIPIGNGVFLLFTIIYSRWWYFLILLMAAMSAIVLEDARNYNIRLSALIQAAFITVIATAIWFVRDEEGQSLVFHKGRFVVMVLFSLVCTGAVLVTDLLRNSKNATVQKKMAKGFALVIISGIMLCSMITLGFTEYIYRRNAYITKDEYVNIYRAGAMMPDPGEAYRFRNYKNPIILYNRQENAAGLSGYSSTTSNSIIEFDELFGYWDVSRRANKGFTAGLPELLGGRYLMLSETNTTERYPDYIYSEGKKLEDIFTVDGKKWDVYEMNACPIGYRTSAIISKSSLMELPVEKRGIALLYASVVEDEEIESLSDIVPVLSSDDILNIIDEDIKYSEGDALFLNPCIKRATEKNTAMALKSFERNSSGFSAISDYDTRSLVYFSIPYDEGFKITVDGKETKAIKSGGLTLLELEAGEHQIKATYHLQGLTLGVLSSFISAFILITLSLLMVFNHKDNDF
ncbi:YfhO family protein [Butyrivibrio sp. FCS014]|uniref:YfhO family protein n=1 Tax=Butyrivibrio sp. FCS014 TaxID=1408304 RepID=UPI00046464D6|nr:YfhO family protein [Butyrivibrio sp. FCS014]